MFLMNEVMTVSCELTVIVIIYCSTFSASYPAEGVIRRVPRKSVFIAPKIYRDECDEGFSRSITRKCIEIIVPDQRGWENILLARLRDIEYDYDEDRTTSSSERGDPHPTEEKSDILLDRLAESEESTESMREGITWQDIERVFDDPTSIINESDPSTDETKSVEEETASGTTNYNVFSNSSVW